MNTYTPYSSVLETFTYPTAPDAGTPSVTVYYELDDIVVNAAAPTLVSGNKYSVDISEDLLGAAGVYRMKWSCLIGGTAFYSYTEFKIEELYVTSDQFFIDFPEYDSPSYVARFVASEKMARRVIDTYCGQSFQFIKNKTFKYEGNGRNKIYLGYRLNNFYSVFIDESDFTDDVSIDFRSKYYLKLNDQYPYADSRIDDLASVTFPYKTIVKVSGDWGWVTVPSDIQQAASLLIADMLDDTRREHYRYGITKLEQGNNRLEFDKGIFNSTGNIDVDTLLMDYVFWIMDYVT
jgi:hypothetical protein